MDAATTRTTTDTPPSAAPGIDLADGGSAANRILVRVPPEDLDKTVLVQGAKSTPSEAPKSP
jgi:hypothetical protein